METPSETTNHTIINKATSVVDGYLISNDKRISLESVTGMKYGWMPIRLDMYTIGSRYILEVKSPDQIVQVSFRSWFRIQKEKQYARFSALMDAIWEPTVVRLLNETVDRINEGATVNIGKCHINADGIMLKTFAIRWDDLSYQNNYNKLTINSKSNASVWTNLYYSETDNVHILRYFLDYKFSHA